MEELSKPIIRDTMDRVQFNPDVFNVSEAAKKAKASARIEELAEPIRRGKWPHIIIIIIDNVFTIIFQPFFFTNQKSFYWEFWVEFW